jgi:hypothetical protein
VRWLTIDDGKEAYQQRPVYGSNDKHSIYPPYQLRQYDSISKNISLFDREEKSLSWVGTNGTILAWL